MGVQDVREAAKGGLLATGRRAPNFDDIPVTLLYHTVVDKDWPAGAARSCRRDGADHHRAPHQPTKEGKPVRYVHERLQTGGAAPARHLRLDMQTGSGRSGTRRSTPREEVVVVPKDGGKDEDDVYCCAPCLMLVAAAASLTARLWIRARCRMWLEHPLPLFARLLPAGTFSLKKEWYSEI